MASEDNYAAAFGRRVEAARRAAGITEERLGEFLQLSQPTIVRLENGHESVRLSIVQLHTLATELNTHLSWLLTGERTIWNVPSGPAMHMLNNCAELAKTLAERLPLAVEAAGVPQVEEEGDHGGGG